MFSLVFVSSEFLLDVFLWKISESSVTVYEFYPINFKFIIIIDKYLLNCIIVFIL